MPRTPIAFLLILLLSTAAFAAVAPLTDETELDSTTDSDYVFTPPVAAGRGSGFVVAWTATFTRYPSGSQLDDWGGRVDGRLVGTDGQPQGGKLALVPEVHKFDLGVPALATDSSGRYAVVWSSAPQLHPHVNYWLRRFSPTGAALSTTRLDQYRPAGFQEDREGAAVALGAAGRAFAVWPRPQPSRPEQISLFGQVVLPSGQPALPRFQVTNRAVSQRSPQLGTDSRGSSVLVYQNIGPHGFPALYLRRYDRNGRPAGGDVRLTPADKQQANPALDVHPSGRFVVAWQEGSHVWARLFEPPNRPLGPAFVVDSGSRFVFLPDVAIGHDGTIFVTWQGLVPERAGQEVWARAFDPSGTPLGEEFRVDQFSAEPAEPSEEPATVSPPAVAASESGTFLVAWSRVDSSPEFFSINRIVSRLYGVTGPAVP